MTPTHRPLSPWIAHLVPTTSELGLVNDGDHRSDARDMGYFAEGWRRVAVPLGAESSALGLRRDDGQTVVELTDLGAPIAISPVGVEAIAHIEQRWPVIDGTAIDVFPQLGRESLSVRYWLLERLDAEGDPPDEIFAILPWDLLDRAVETVSAGLEPGGRVGELVEIRHWLTPAIRGLTGPVEQLDHGLRAGDRLAARRGASALLTNLPHMPLSRIPEHTRIGLGRLVNLLGRVDPLYSHVSRVLVALLTGQPPRSRIRAELHSSLEAAAGTDNVREHVEVLGDDLQRVQLLQTRAGRVRVTARLVGVDAVDSPLAARVGMFLPVRVTPRGDGHVQRFWITLAVEDDHLVGAVSLVLPPGVSEVDADGAPVGADELASADPDDLLASLHASAATTAQRWLRIAADLPDGHPVRIAAKAFEGSM